MKDQAAQHARRAAGSQYVVFRLGETLFGVDIHQMLRIVHLKPITRVPRAPHFLEGVVNQRGQVLPVVDLHKRLALPGAEYGDQARILIVEMETQALGMLVDAVVGIWRLPDEAIQPPPEMVAQVNGVYLTAVARHDDLLIVLLDLTRVLTVEERENLDAWQTGQRQ